MSTYARLLDYDEVLRNLPEPPTIINEMDLDFSTDEGRAALISQLMMSFDGDVIAPIPVCSPTCGHLVGEHAVGETCPHCGNKPVNLVDKSAESSLWVAPPEGVKTLINPEAWTVIAGRCLHGKRFNALEWVCDPWYRESYPALTGVLEQFFAEGHVRGINYFFDNFDAVMAFMFRAGLVRGLKDQKLELEKFIQNNRSKIFTRYLPVPSSLFVVHEKTAMGTYSDDKSTSVPDAIFTITSTICSPVRLSLGRRESYATKAITALAKCYQDIYTKFIGGKYGLIRKQLIGSRLHMTARAVITSLSGVHQYNELHIPWGLATQLFKYHLTAKLLQRGFTPNEALTFIEDNATRYNDDLNTLFEELINESPDGEGIPCIFQRNPSLTRLSAQCLRITKVKTDVTDNTFSVSVLILRPFNADKTTLVKVSPTAMLVRKPLELLETP